MAHRDAGDDRGGERQTIQTEAKTGRDRRYRQRQGETDAEDRGKNILFATISNVALAN